MRNLKILFLVCLFATYVFGKDMVIISKDDFWTNIQLNGKNETCNIDVRKWELQGSRILSDDCLFLRNSKKIDIICTKNKTICKTDKEVIDYADKASITIDHETKKEKTKTIKEDNCGLSFDQILKAREECKINIFTGEENNISQCYKKKIKVILQKQGCRGN